MPEGVVIWGAIAISAAVLAGILAGLKHRDFSFWIGWSFLFPPMVIFLAFLPRLPVRPRRRTLDEEDQAEAS